MLNDEARNFNEAEIFEDVDEKDKE